jgi:hypothetical protein
MAWIEAFVFQKSRSVSVKGRRGILHDGRGGVL